MPNEGGGDGVAGREDRQSNVPTSQYYIYIVRTDLSGAIDSSTLYSYY